MTRLIVTGVCLVLLASPTRAQPYNDCTAIILHGADSSLVGCDEVNDIDCHLVYPTVDISLNTYLGALVLIRNYEAVAGVQCAFAVSESWIFTFGAWECQPNQIAVLTPGPPWGPTDGTITTAFDLLTGGALAPIGRMQFAAFADGCMSVIDSSLPGGAHVVDNEFNATPVIDGHRGSICVGAGGTPACECIVPVEPVTWGAIKSLYRR